MRAFAAVLALVFFSLPPVRGEPSDEEMGAFAFKAVRADKKHPRLVFAPRDSDRAVMRIVFRAGSFDDGRHPGLTKLTQHAMLGASADVDYEEFRLDVFAAAAELEIETGVRESAVTLTAPAKSFEKLAKRFASLCLDADLDPEALEAVKRRALRAHGDMDVDAMVSMLGRAALSEPGYGNDPDGDTESIGVLDADDLTRHLAGPMSPANATVVVTGKFDVARMRKLLKKYAGGKRGPAVHPSPELAGTYQLKSALEAELVAYPLRLDSARAVAAAHLASALLGDRIEWQLRRMGSAYSTLTEPVHREWLDGLLIALPMHAGSSARPGDLLADIVEQVRAGAFTEEELEESRRAVMGRFQSVDRDPRALARALGLGEGESAWLSPEVFEELTKMTKMELMAAIGESIVPSHAIHVRLSAHPPTPQARSTP